MTPETSLRVIKVIHTIAWAFFVTCIVAIPILGFNGHYTLAAVAIGMIVLEGLILVLNGWQCPFTKLAARFTDDRSDNFDIYLPVWLARHNKLIFTILFLGGTAFTVSRWIGWLK